ncbi:MAG: hypothetical protein RL701_1998, partial [Pseudomonadota bacterium]
MHRRILLLAALYLGACKPAVHHVPVTEV